MVDVPHVDVTPDLDLVEYLLVCAPTLAGLGSLAGSITDLVEGRMIDLIDVVVLQRAEDQVQVTTAEPADLPELVGLAACCNRRIRLSWHDVDLAAVTLEPGTAALLLLVEDRWAELLASTARGVGGRVAAGERIGRERLRAALDQQGDADKRGPAGRDLIGRTPALGRPLAMGSGSAVDQADQVRYLARLVSRGVLSLEQYELQRRRVLGG